MPNVVGVNVSAATAALIVAGITPNNGTVANSSTPTLGYFADWPVGITWVVRSAGHAPGVVTAQTPAAGTTNVALGAAVTLTVANFPNGVANEYSGGGYS